MLLIDGGDAYVAFGVFLARFAGVTCGCFCKAMRPAVCDEHGTAGGGGVGCHFAIKAVWWHCGLERCRGSVFICWLGLMQELLEIDG